MRAVRRVVLAALMLSAAALVVAAPAAAEQTVRGEVLDPALCGPSWVESMEAAIERDRLAEPPVNHRARNGAQGVWAIPSRGATTFPRSGIHNAVNKWGDTRMGIGFPGPVDVHGAYFAGQADEGAWTTGIRVLGYRDGVAVDETDWFDEIGPQPRYFDMDLRGVDRIVIISRPVLQGGGWYGMDDFAYTPVDAFDVQPPEKVVLDFEDLPYRHKLTGSQYAGLTWETGTGDFSKGDGVPAPKALIDERPQRPGGGDGDGGDAPSRNGGTTPELIASFQGVLRGDATSMSFPPDTDGAIGPNHYVETVNRNFAIYDKATGDELVNILLGAFLPGSNGDPRVVFDHHSGRWFVIVTDFSATKTIFIAVSLTDDPMGAWFKTSFLTAQGGDVGRWPDYPTLGVDAHGIYMGVYMIGGPGHTIFAIDKAPMIAPIPTLGTITAFRNLDFAGAIQPAHVYGTPDGAYCVSLNSSSSLRLRRVNPPLSPEATLTDLGTISVPTFGDPPNAPALGSSTALNTVDDRLMMSVYRDGSLWTAHTISVNGRAACRWYEIDVASTSLVQWGNVADPTLHYFFPSIMVNAAGDVAMGFSGSSPTQYAGCYYTGRITDDPLGEMGPPVQYKVGTGPQNNIDSYGRNRWGDYSYTTLDPIDQATFWTIQEYGHSTDIWGTYIGVLTQGPLDCNGNGIPDACDIDCGPPGGDCDVPGCGQSEDCNENGIPDECEPDDDCNSNGVPDFCELYNGTAQDCNENGILDECDIDTGFSDDCQPNGVPDECEIGSMYVTIAFPMDDDPGWDTQDLWAFGQPTGQGGQYGGPDPSSGYTGTNVYGYNLNGDYQNNLPERHLTSTPIDCTGMQDVQLSFWRWLGVEQSVYDHAYVRVSNNGVDWVTIWSNASEVSDSSWQLQQFDISNVADNQSEVYLRWTMGETDTAWRFCGWNIDDVEVTGYVVGGGEGDCNANAVPDDCDIANGTSQDINGNGIPDECENLCPADVNGDGTVNVLDLLDVLAAWGAAGGPEDVNFDGVVDVLDLLELLSEWGPCAQD